MTDFGPQNLGVVACNHVIKGIRPVRIVTHYREGDWAFSCGQPDHSEAEDAADEYHLIHLEHVLSRDSTLDEVANLPRGWSTKRDEVGGDWHRYEDTS